MILDKDWYYILEPEIDSEYFEDLQMFLDSRIRDGAEVYPGPDDVFRALNSTKYEDVKVVIIGQDPYAKEGQANGLAFSVNKGQVIPNSLCNIYKELESDLGITSPGHGDLSFWSKQGVMLLNSVLTVEKDDPGCHGLVGWEQFTDMVIHELSTGRENIVFILWGNYAKSKGKWIDRSKHLVLEAAHPSAFKKFVGCQHFSRTNDYLSRKGKQQINWHIPRLAAPLEENV